MPRILLVRDLKHEQIEFPEHLPAPEGRRGGRTSSLHLRRGSVRDVTQEELDWMRENTPEILRCCDVLSDPVLPSRAARRLKAAAQRAEAALSASKGSSKGAGGRKRSAAKKGTSAAKKAGSEE